MRYGIVIAGFACWALMGEPLGAQNVGQGIEPTGATRGHQTGTRGANFLHIGTSARARALADAGTALIGGATVLYYNPAAAALAEGFQASATYTDLYGGSGITHAYLGVIVPIGEVGAFGAHAIVLSSGEIEVTTELSPEGFDPLAGNTVEWSAVAIGLTYSRMITDRLAVGATGKFVQEGIDFANVTWFGFDVGTVFETGLFGTRLAAAITHIGGDSRFEGPAVESQIPEDLRPFDDQVLGSDLRFRFDTDKMEMPTTFRLGLYTPLLGTAEAIFGLPGNQHKIDLLTEMDDSFDADIETRIGLEYSFREVLFLRTGKYFANEDQAPWNFNDGLSAGLGLRVPFRERGQLGLDYAYTNMGILEGVHTFGLEVGF